jgi:hypothetical protein
MRTRMIVSILIGLTLILSTFISTVSIVQKIAYAQARTQLSNNGVPVPNSMNPASTVVGRNSVEQGIIGAPSSVQMTSTEHPIGKIVTAIKYLGMFGFLTFGILKYKQHMDNPTQEPIQHPLVVLKYIMKNFRPVTPAREHLP